MVLRHTIKAWDVYISSIASLPTANKCPPASCQMIQICSPSGPYILLIKEGLILACLLALREAAHEDVCGWNKRQDRGYIFSHAERKKHQKQMFPHEKRRGLCLCLSSFVQLLSLLMSLNEKVGWWADHGAPYHWLWCCPAGCCSPTGNHSEPLQQYWDQWSSEASRVYGKPHRTEDDDFITPLILIGISYKQLRRQGHITIASIQITTVSAVNMRVTSWWCHVTAVVNREKALKSSDEKIKNVSD